MSEDKYRAALDMAAKQLSYRALSAKMLRDKLLAKGHDEEAADYALAWLTERSMLNDELFAESVVRGYTRKGYGAACKLCNSMQKITVKCRVVWILCIGIHCLCSINQCSRAAL